MICMFWKSSANVFGKKQKEFEKSSKINRKELGQDMKFQGGVAFEENMKENSMGI